MAFTQANFNCIANGPLGNVYTYHTADNVVVTGSTYFTPTAPAGLKVNDIILLSHTDGAGASATASLLVYSTSTNAVSMRANV